MAQTEGARMDARVAIVTGGTQGLGEAIATLFAERGAKGLVICGRNAEKGKRVAERLSGRGCPTEYVQADLGVVEDCRKVVAAADARFGRVDALVNAAGLTDRGTIWDTSPELWDRILAVNVRGPFFLMQETRQDHAPGEDPRHHGQHPQHVVPRRPAVHHRLLHLEGRAAHAHQERRLQPAAPGHPGQRAQHRLDGYARRGPHHAHLPRLRRTAGRRAPRRSCHSGAC